MKKEIIERMNALKETIKKIETLLANNPGFAPLEEALASEKSKLEKEQGRLSLIEKAEKANKSLAKIASKIPTELNDLITKWLSENQETTVGVRVEYSPSEDGTIKPFVSRIERTTKKERGPRPENSIPGGGRGAQCEVIISDKTYIGLGAKVARMISDDNSLGWDFSKSVNWHKTLESYAKKSGGTYKRID